MGSALSRTAGLLLALAAVVAAMVASIALGKVSVSWETIRDSFMQLDADNRDQLIIRTVRVPRALLAMAVGSALGAAGAIMQGVTRNPLAGPELFGVNQGAAAVIVAAIYMKGSLASDAYLGYAFAGALVAGVVVFLLGSAGGRGLTPVRLVVAGATLSLLLASLTQALLVLDEESLDAMRFWLAGSLTGRSSAQLAQVAPFLAGGLVAAVALGRQVNLLNLGEEVAQSLGSRLVLIKAISLGLVGLLAGAAVALVGPIAFVGLVAPHIARFAVGQDYRWIIPYAALLGALLLLLSDIAARFLIPGQEISAGIVTALLGTPFLIYLAQRRT